MKVLSHGKFAVYVYEELGHRHKLPHCHVRWDENDTSVAIFTLTKLAGPNLPRQARKLLQANLEAIWQGWEELNS